MLNPFHISYELISGGCPFLMSYSLMLIEITGVMYIVK